MKLMKLLPATGAALLLPLAALAQEATAEVAAEVTPVMDKGDVAWMMTATLLVLFMIIPGLFLIGYAMMNEANGTGLSHTAWPTILIRFVIRSTVQAGSSLSRHRLKLLFCQLRSTFNQPLQNQYRFIL